MARRAGRDGLTPVRATARRTVARLASAAADWIARPGGPWRGRILRHRLIGRLALVGVAAATSACVPASNPGALAPTLAIDTLDGGSVAVQNGIPVPSFDRQQRPTIDLDGTWRVERTVFDSDLSLTPRDAALPTIEAQAEGRTEPGFDDAAWETTEVPGSLNQPPDRQEVGGWYRRTFVVPRDWAERAVTLKLGAANYVADVWLNGTWLGYHEGGTTPFAFDAKPALRPGTINTISVRVDNPAWGTRNDIVPWGLADWYNFGGLTRSVWLEASDEVSVARADVTPHLDGLDVGIVVSNRAEDARTVTLTVDVLPALVTPDNLLDPDAASLLTGTGPLATVVLDPLEVAPGGAARVDTSVLLAGAEAWSPASPSLYVVRVSASVDRVVVDRLHESFGFRVVAVDPDRPVVTLNGAAVTLPGVAVHDQRLVEEDGRVVGRLATLEDLRSQLRRAKGVGARLIRTGHTPANPDLLRLADRLGMAIWEEIPLYHYTPQTFDIAMRRGIPQQMLREMALRDMNRPSVLFHGLANESTGEEPRARALAELHDVDRGIDGSRLTGQAAYGFNPSDTTSSALDVAGWTMYYGVFYGSDPTQDTAAALETAHETYPGKPIMVLEFGRWADDENQAELQRRIFAETAVQVFVRRGTRPGGYVGAGVWWTLEDYATLRPQIEVEHFGMFDTAGRPRPVLAAARALFEALPAGLEGDSQVTSVPGGRGTYGQASAPGPQLVAYLAYGAVTVVVLLGVALVLLLVRGGRGRVPLPRRTRG